MNNPNQPVNQPVIPDQTSFPDHPVKNQIGNHLLIILSALILLLIVGGGAYYLGTQKNNSINQAPNINTNAQAQPSPTQKYSEPSPTTIATKNGMVIYEHPKAHYTLEYPEIWKVISSDFEQDYQDFTVQSPDYQLSDGYPVLEKGAEFFVRVENSTEESINDIFKKDPLIPEIATNKTKTSVDGTEAIQYDYSYEGHNATMTIFLKNSKYYTIKYRYVDNAGKQSEWNIYLNLLKSFKTK